MSDQLTPLAMRQAVESLGFELVDLEVVGNRQHPVVRIRIDHPGGSVPGAGVTTDDCRLVSRSLEQQLEASGAVRGRWTMEVSSPGVERPVRFAEHWRRYVGRKVKLKAAGLKGRPEAVIVAVPDDERVVLALDDGEVTVALGDIREATLVIDWSALLGGNAGDI